MAFTVNQKKDFTVAQAGFAGNLKPNKVKARKVHATVSGITPAGTPALKAMQGKVPIDNSK